MTTKSNTPPTSLTPRYFEGSLDLHTLQNNMNYFEYLHNRIFSALVPVTDPSQQTDSGSHNFNKGTNAAAGTTDKVGILLLVAATADQTLDDAKAAQLVSTPKATFAFNAPGIFISDTPTDVVAFRLAA